MYLLLLKVTSLTLKQSWLTKQRKYFRTAIFWWRYSLSKLILECLCFVRIPSFFNAFIYIFPRATCLEHAVFCNSWFSTVNLVSMVTLSIYQLKVHHIHIGVFRVKLCADAQSECCTPKHFSVNTMSKHFASNFLSQGSIE